MKQKDWWKFWKKKQGTAPKVVKVKRVTVTAKDIQENIRRIKVIMDNTPVGTPEFEALQKELKTEIDTLAKTKEANQVISVRDALVIGGTTVSLVFFIALAREYPSALKVASTILKWVPFKGI